MATVLDTLVTEIIFKGDTTALENMQKRLNNFTSNLNAMGRQLGLAGGAIAAFTGLSVKSFANFEDEMAKIVGLVGVPAEQLAEWRKPLLDIARDTAVGPQALAEALFFITSAGLRGKEAMEVLEQAAKAQTAGMGEAKIVAQLVTSAINAYGVENLSAADATDALTEAIREGQLEPASMANAIGRVIPLTSAMNVEFNELAGLMAAMSRTGTPVEEAVTSIQAIMTTLLNPTREAEDALSGVGLTLTDLRRQVANEGILPMLVGLKEAFDGNIEPTAAVFGNVRALRGVLDLLGPQMQGNIDLLDEMADSTGVLDEATEAAQQTIGFKMRQATVTGQVALLEFGRAIEPIAQFILNMLTPALERLVGWFQSGNPIVRVLAQSVAVLGGALVVVSGTLFAVAASTKAFTFALSGASSIVWLWRNALLSTRLQLFLLTLQTWRANAAKLAHRVTTLLSVAATNALSLSFWRNVVAQVASRIAMIAGTIATIAATVATTAFGIAMIVATGPIGLVILGIAALIAGVVLLIKNWGWVKEKAAVVWDFILGAVQGVWNWIKGNWPLLLAILTGPIGLAVWAVVKFKDNIIGVFTGVKDAVVGIWQSIWDFILGAVQGVWEWIKGNWPLLLAILTGPIGLAVWAVVKFKDNIIGVFTGVKDAVVGIWQSIWDFILGVWEKIKAPIEAVTGFVKGVGGTIVGGVQAVVPGYQQGGLVPGALGKPLLSMLHGGELVLPQPLASNLRAIGQGYDLTPIIPGYDYGRGGGAPRTVHEDNRTINISDGAIVINPAPGQNAEEIAREVKKALGDELRNTAQDLDSDILR